MFKIISHKAGSPLQTDGSVVFADGINVPSSRLSVCHTSEPCTNGWTNRDAVCVEDSGRPREPCIRWGPDPPWERATLTEEGASYCKVYGHSKYGHLCKKTAESIEMPFGLWARMGPGKHVFAYGEE